MNMWFGIGLGAGLLVAAIVLTLMKKSGKQCDYDERQVAVRGKAFKAGFITFAILEFCVFLIELITEAPFMLFAPGIASIVIIIVSFLVFLEIAIFGDAYFSPNKPLSKSWCLVMLLFGVVTVVRGLTAEDLWGKCMNLSLGAFFIVVMVSILIKAMITKKALEKDSGDEE